MHTLSGQGKQYQTTFFGLFGLKVTGNSAQAAGPIVRLLPEQGVKGNSVQAVGPTETPIYWSKWTATYTTE